MTVKEMRKRLELAQIDQHDAESEMIRLSDQLIEAQERIAMLESAIEIMLTVGRGER